MSRLCFLLITWAAWKDITSGDFTIRMLEGSHFYLKEAENEKHILDYVTNHLEACEMDYF